MRYEELLHRLPKVELHCHLIGSMRPETAADLARKHGVQLPHDAHFLYDHVNSKQPDDPRYAQTRIPMAADNIPPVPDPSFSLFQVADWIAPVLRDQGDFARVVYESMVDAATSSNVRYREIAFEPTTFFNMGISYQTIVDGLVEGVRAAERDAGIVGRLIGGIDRGEPPAASVEVVEQMLAHPRDEVVGIGLQAFELAGPPELFAEAYALAGRGGCVGTAHAKRADPSSRNVLSCLDLLGCDRIDHGYFVLEDDDAVEALPRPGRRVLLHRHDLAARTWIPWRRRRSRRWSRPPGTSIASDHPAMFPTTVSEQYAILATELGFAPETMRQIRLERHRRRLDRRCPQAGLRDELTREYDALLPATRR